MKKEGYAIIFDYAHREKDHVTLGEDGLSTLHLLLYLGRVDHARWLKNHHRKKLKELDEWTQHLIRADKIVERIFFSAKKVVVEVDWDKWSPIEKELGVEVRRMGK